MLGHDSLTKSTESEESTAIGGLLLPTVSNMYLQGLCEVYPYTHLRTLLRSTHPLKDSGLAAMTRLSVTD
jgi:hypothetical protein